MLGSFGVLASYKILYHRVSSIEAAYYVLLSREGSCPYTSYDENALVRVSEEPKTLLLKILQAPVAHLSDSNLWNVSLFFLCRPLS